MADINVKSNGRHLARLHPLAIRVMHWINALTMIVLIMSGWADLQRRGDLRLAALPVWMTMGGGPEGALQWHFLAMWILVVNGIAYLAYGLSTGRFRRMLLPIRIAEIIAEMRRALALELSHDDLTHYNAVQRVLYVGIIVVIIVQVLSGLVIWKPVQFSELAYSLLRLPGRASRALPGHGRHRRVPACACRPGADRAEDPGRHADRRSRRAARRNGKPQSQTPHTRQARILRRHEPHVTSAHPSPSLFRPKRAIDQSVLEENQRAGPKPSTGARSCAAASASAPSPC